MSRTRATSLLRSGLSSSIQLRFATPKVHSRHVSQNSKPWRAGEVYGLRTEELIQPDFYRISWVAPKRTLFYVPGSSQKMIDKAWSLEVDNITLDLEDSVHASEKAKARDLIVENLKKKDPHPTAEVAIRINVDDADDMNTEFQVLGQVSDRFDALVIPKFTSEAYRRVGMLTQVHFEKKKKFATYGLIESPWSLVNLDNMLKVLRLQLIHPYSLHLRGLIFGAEDYAHSAGITRTPSLLEMAYARQKVVTVAKAWNLQAFDLVSTNFRDLDTLRAECEQGASFGFTGKQTIHPNQIPVIHEGFSPSTESVQHATRLLQQYIKEVAGEKRGAWEFEGKMVDQPVIRKAKKTLELGVAYSIEKSEAEPVLNEVKEIDGEPTIVGK